MADGGLGGARADEVTEDSLAEDEAGAHLGAIGQ